MPREKLPLTRNIVSNNPDIIINLQDLWRNPDEVREVFKNINKFKKNKQTK